MDIGAAVKAMREGSRVARRGWNGENMYLKLRRPSSLDELLYVYICTMHGNAVPWTCSQTDLLADDWTVVTNV